MAELPQGFELAPAAPASGVPDGFEPAPLQQPIETPQDVQLPDGFEIAQPTTAVPTAPQQFPSVTPAVDLPQGFELADAPSALVAAPAEATIASALPGSSIVRGVAKFAGDTALAAAQSGVIEPETAAGIITSTTGVREALAPGPSFDKAFKDFERIKDTGGVGDFVAWGLKHPGAILSVIGESFGQSVPVIPLSIAGAAAGTAVAPGVGTVTGFVGGSAAGSAFIEFNATFRDFLERKKFDLTDDKQLANALANPELMAEAREFALKRGLTIGVVDGFFSLLGARGAGRGIANVTTRVGERLFRTTAKETTLAGGGVTFKRLAGEATANTILETFGEGLGEGAAQLATEGRVNLMEVLLEGTAGFGASVPSAAISVAIDRKNQRRLQAGVQEVLNDFVPEAPVPSITQAATAGATHFGVVQEGQEALLSSNQDEAIRGSVEDTARTGKLVGATAEQITAPQTEINFARSELIRERAIVETPEAQVALEALLADQQNTELYGEFIALGGRIQPRGQEGRLTVRPEEVEVRHDDILLGKVQNPDNEFDMLRDVNLLTLFEDSDITIVPKLLAQAISDERDAHPMQVLETLQAHLTATDSVINTKLQAASTSSEFYQILADDLDALTNTAVAIKTGVLSYDPSSTFEHTVVSTGTVSAEEALARHRVKRSVSIGDVARGVRIANVGRGGLSLRTLDVDPNATVVLTTGKDVTAAEKRTAATIEKIITKMRKQFRMKGKILLHIGNTDGHENFSGLGKDPDANGVFMGMQSGDALIWVKAGVPASNIFATVAHEMGHALSFMRFGSLSMREQARIFGSYQRRLETEDQGKKTYNDAVLARRVGLRESGRDITSVDRLVDLNYYLSFEEWFAEQTSRWASTSRPVVGDVAKFFRALAKDIVRMLKFAKKNFPEGQVLSAEEEMQTWLESMYTGTEPGNYGDTVRKVMDAKSTEANRRWLGNDSVPYQAETSNIVAAMNKFAAKPRKGGGIGGPPSDAANLGGEQMPPAQMAAHVDRAAWLYKFFMNFRQVADRNKNIEPLQNYARIVELMQLEANTIMHDAETRIKMWRQIRKRGAKVDGLRESDRITNYLMDLTELQYMSQEEMNAKVRRQPTPEERAALAAQHSLTSEGVALAEGIEEDFRQVIQRIDVEARVAADRIENPNRRATEHQRIDKMTQELLKVPYFPSSRFGRFTVTVRNEAGQVIEFQTVTTRGKQKRLALKLQTQHGPTASLNLDSIPEEAKQFQGMPPWLMDKMLEMPGVTQLQKDWIQLLRAELSPSRSMQKNFLKRKGIAGASRDGERAYAQYFFRHARAYARVRHAPQLKNEIDLLSKSAKELPVGDVTHLRRLANYMNDHMNELMNPAQDWAILRSVSAIWYLGASPASAALNLSQLAIGTAPFAATKFGDVKALNALRRAMTDMTKFYRNGEISDAENAKMAGLSLAIDENLIEESMAAELAGLASAGNLDVLSTKLGQAWNNVGHVAMWMFQQTEKMNRRVTFRAGWDLAMENPNTPWLQTVRDKHYLQYQDLLSHMTEAEATAYLSGKELILQTHYDYSRAARPRFMRGKFGVLFSLFSFTQNTVMMLMNNPDMLARYGFIMLALAGPMGLIPDDLEDILNRIAQMKFGKDFNLEREAGKYVNSILGDNSMVETDTVLHGVSRVGFGIPALMDSVGVTWWPSFDRSQSIALNRILPLSPTALLQPGADYERAVTQTTQDLSGAAFGIGFAMLRAMMNDRYAGDIKRWEGAFPRALKGVSKSFRMAVRGGETDPSGNVVLPVDVSDPQHVAELVGQAMGYTPTRFARFWDRRSAEREIQAVFQIERGMLLRNFYRSRFVHKDADKTKDIMGQIRAFNKRAPDPALRISVQTILRSIKQRLRRKAELDRGKSPGIRKGISEEVAKLYPDATSVKKVK